MRFQNDSPPLFLAFLLGDQFFAKAPVTKIRVSAPAPYKNPKPYRHGLGTEFLSQCLCVRTPSATTRDRNLQFQGAVSTEFFEFSPADFCSCFSGRALGDRTKVTEKAQNADFRRKPQIFADSPLLLEIQACGGRRKPQKTGHFRRKPKTAGNRRLGSVTSGPSPLARP